MNSTSQARLRAALLASATLLAAPAAMAQTAPAPTPPVADTQDQPAPGDDDIVVQGIRETLRTSIQEKKLETAIVDTLSSNEIGDLPALSVGEAIQTITGATTHREKGGASEIALRGLGSFLSNTTFNGREASNGSGDRAVNFNQFPSELINGIKIYKSQQANLVEGGVAGTIELGTIRPLAFKTRRVQAEIKGNYSPYQDRVTGSDATGYRATLSYVDQFDMGGLGRVGVALGFQRNQTNNPEETVAGSSTWVACNASIVVANNNCTEVTRAQGNAGTPFYLVPNSITYRQISETDTRDAFFGAIQWQPTSTLDINIDGQYSNREYVENRHDLNLSETRYGLTNVVYDENHIVRKLNGITSLESTNAILSRAEEYLGYGASIAWRPTDRLTVTLDGSYSRTIRTEVERNARLRTDPTDVNGVRTVFNNMRIPYTYEVLPGNFAPTITIDPRFDLTNHNLFWDDARMRRDENQRRNTIKAGRFDVGYTLDGFLTRLSAGGRYSELTYSDYDDRKEFNLNPAITEDRRINNLCRQPAFPQVDFLSAAEGNTINRWATFDADCLFREYVGASDPGRNSDIRSVANRDVAEKTYAGYLMGEYKGTLGGFDVRGNFGGRIVRTEVTSNGLRSDLNVVTNPDGSIRLVASGNFQTVTIENATTRFLPSANAVFEPARNTVVRLAGYRGMSKPAPSALGAGRTIQLADGTSFTNVADAISLITANGSPRLEPLMSWNVDAAFEWYPNRDSILAATLYKKWFTGGFIPVVTNEPFVIGGQTVSVPVVQTQNSPDKSSVYGLELTLANRFSWLPRPLDGFGGKVSYNYAISDFENEDIRLGDVLDPVTGAVTPGIIPPANLSGYSKHVVSAQLYYQLAGFTVSSVYNYRSKYYQDFVGGNSQLRYVRGNETFDLRASYDVNKAVRFQVEAVNIFDSPKVTDMPVEGSVRQYHYYGARYFLGLRVRL
ncbi:TonB-dependent receptor [Sphingomonas donggukensis]|uniref:TonB-dependent receptor n=1 Tax=Sphingomonas donggukensis TaxID=2949093 RepID=A0ABY4TQT4_9SPHN|nr:TonB-dependent receptor [Sphingomonas donggukensis]URW74717.1 TonB-dependent receptor [Sphingomonas donggukensis]